MEATKTEKVLNHLMVHGKITSWDALRLYKATRLASIIFNLKKRGYNITTEMKYNNGVGYAEYRLEDEDV